MPASFTPLTEEQTREVYSLLCIIHGDGGQTIDAFGMDKAIAKAKQTVIKNRELVAGFLEGARDVG